jgi:hypothetical protein
MTHQKKEKVNNNRTITDKQFSACLVFFFLALTVIMISGGGLTVPSRANAATATLPNCTDPTGQNLPCMIVLSTLPPPPNAIQCQETSGQILSCSYTTQNVSNGQQIVVITVYVPVNYIFSSPTTIKVVVHKTETTTTTTKIIRKVVKPIHFPYHTPEYWKGFRIGLLDGRNGIYDLGAACGGLSGKDFDHCSFGYRYAYVTKCRHGPNGCGDGPTTLPERETEGLVAALPSVLSPALTTAIDCKANPDDPSCLQSPQPETQTPPTTITTPTTQPEIPGKSTPEKTVCTSDEHYVVGKGCVPNTSPNPNPQTTGPLQSQTTTPSEPTVHNPNTSGPQSLSNNNPQSNNLPTNNNLPPSSNTPSSGNHNGNTGGGENGGGSTPSQPSTLDNGNSDGGDGGSSSSSGSSHTNDHDGGNKGGKSDSDDSKSSSSSNH